MSETVIVGELRRYERPDGSDVFVGGIDISPPPGWRIRLEAIEHALEDGPTHRLIAWAPRGQAPDPAREGGRFVRVPPLEEHSNE